MNETHTPQTNDLPEQTGNFPSWWPECPWPASVWRMTTEEYFAFIPNEQNRTAVSGLLMREGWELACRSIYKELIEQGLLTETQR